MNVSPFLLGCVRACLNLAGKLWEGAPRASEHLINPNSSSLNEVLITLADSLKTRRQGPRRLALTYMIVWSEGKSFHCAIKIPCVCVRVRSSVHKTVVSFNPLPTRSEAAIVRKRLIFKNQFSHRQSPFKSN